MTPEPATPEAERKMRRLCAAVGGVVALLTWLAWRDEPIRRHLDLRFYACLAGAILVLLSTWLPGSAARGRTVADLGRRLAILALTAWAAWGLTWTVGVEFDRLVTRDDVNPWNHFHYYLGAKYFEELGYTDLYEQALAVDREGDGAWARIPRYRDLTRYEVVPVARAEFSRNERWTDARWKAFGEDVRLFQGQLDHEGWRRLLKDRGYNATPPWTALGRLLVRPSPTPEGLALLSMLDPLLLLFAFLVAARVFGGLRSAVAASFVVLYFGNELHVVGGLYQYDYVAALVLAAAATRRGRGALAGALVVYAAMVRIFPGFLVFGLALWTVKRWRATGALPDFSRRFARGFAIACVVGVLVGCLGGRGAHAWPEFVEAISVHSGHHRFGNKRIGLQHAWTHDWSRGFGRWETKRHRVEGWEDRKAAWAGSAALLLVVWLGATWIAAGEDPLEPMITSLLLVFAGVVLSRYYWSVAALWILAGGRPRDGPVGGRGPGTVAALLFGWCAAVYGYAKWGGSREFGWYVLANGLFGLGAVILLVLRSAPATRRLLQLDREDGGDLTADGTPALD